MGIPSELRAIRSGGSGGEVDLKSSRDGDLRVAQYLPPYAMLVAAGKVFGVDCTASTAIAPTTTVPTTTALWTVYNANDTKHLILIQVGIALQSGTAGLGLSIWAAAAKGAQTAIVADYAGVIKSCLDGTQRTPNSCSCIGSAG